MAEDNPMKLRSLLLVTGSLFLSAAVAAQTPAPVQKRAAPKAAAKPGTGAKRPLAPRPAFDRTLLRPALLKAKAPDAYDVKFTTTKGDFTLHVTRAWAPLGADRFYNLVKHHFYDGASFFRVLDDFVAQFGVSPYPQVSAAWRNTAFKDDPVKQSNKRGTITFATGGPNTRTTQVFINLGDNARLDRDGFSPFGQVTEGMLTVVKLYGGYGEGAPDGNGPDQEKIEKLGKPYLDKGWPKLDSIKTAAIVTPDAAAGHAAAPATKKPQ
jgi:peptidyl-prolyl cis-trans isomerase A (cyclophilin A)